jgi:Flp pilus assembly protein TadD
VTEPQLNELLAWAQANVGNAARAEEAVARLAEAAAEHPDDPSLRAFLALALHTTGQPALALATMLEAALAAAAHPDGFGPHTRALSDYQLQLIDAALQSRR